MTIKMSLPNFTYKLFQILILLGTILHEPALEVYGSFGDMTRSEAPVERGLESTSVDFGVGSNKYQVS